MKKIEFILILSLSLCTYLSIYGDIRSQDIPLFDSTYYQFNLNDNSILRRPNAAKIADMDNDGDSDVVASNTSNGFTFARNVGNGFYSAPVYYTASLLSSDIAAGDFNNDGLKDVVVSNTGYNWEGNTISIFLNLGNASFAQAVNYAVGTGPTGVTAADLDNDGDNYIAVANYGYLGQGSTVSVLINNGNATFQSALTFPGGNAPNKIRAARINGDNFLDLVIANATGKVNLIFNSGNNNFANRVELISELGYSNEFSGAVAIDDIDNDNDNDILYVPGFRFSGSIDYGSVAVFRNHGNGTFNPVQYLQSVSSTLPSSDVEIADLNSDGWKDIVTTSKTGRTSDGYMVYMNNGTGGFNGPYLKPGALSMQRILTMMVTLTF